MKLANILLAAGVFLAAAGFPAVAQSQMAGQQGGQQTDQQADQQNAPPASPAQEQSTDPQDQTNAQPPLPQGTRLLIGLQEALSTKDDKAGKRFVATTLEPITTAEGKVIPSGVQIRGHIDRVQSAGKTGRARMWLAFDDIGTPRGWRPLVAQLIDAPGIHSIHVAYDHEGEIQAASVNKDQAMKAAAVGAAAGAATAGMATGKEKDVAMAAAMAAATAFMVSYGLGQEITLQKGTKLEIVIERPLHLGRT
ncbi:MAG TPA: hypothetical protein VNV84_01785 [Candidatus Acidoferrales bacterium]|jgi:hypothetical protein|nr:hypothetical protein [Candidatus Acidoferrales bacterium]